MQNNANNVGKALSRECGRVRSYNDAKLRSVLSNPALYQPELVAACEREAQIREKSIPLQDTVKCYDDAKLIELLSNPSIYSDEMVCCCQMEYASRIKKKRQEAQQSALKEELKAQLLKEIEAEQKAALAEQAKAMEPISKKNKAWLWPVVGGVAVILVTVVCLFCFGVFDKKAPVLDPKWEDAPGSSSSYYSSRYPGEYPQASERRLTHADVCYLSKWELKIMRNEILARYGYIFKTAAMREYFSKQDWYEGRYTEVATMLTPLEWENIELIKLYE